MIYNEEYLVGTFTFGFEFEGYFQYDDSQNERDFIHFARSFFKDSHTVDTRTTSMSDDGSIEPDSKRRECQHCYGDGEIDCYDCDGTGKIPNENYVEGETEDEIDCPNCDGKGKIECGECDGVGHTEDEGSTFEWNSPILNVTPKNITDVAKFFDQALHVFDIETNDTCALHIHLGFPKEIEINEGRLWVLLKLATSPMYGKILNYKGYQLYDDHYAPTDFIEKIEHVFATLDGDDSDYNNKQNLLQNIYRDRKFTLLGQHPQGTLEWRGPRGFLDSKNMQVIRGFFIELLYPFVKFIAKSLEEESIIIDGKEVLTRQELVQFVESRKKLIQKHPNQMSKVEKKFSEDVPRKYIDAIMNKYPELNNIDFYIYNVNADLSIEARIKSGVLNNFNFMGNSYFSKTFQLINSTVIRGTIQEADSSVISVCKLQDFDFYDSSNIKVDNCTISATNVTERMNITRLNLSFFDNVFMSCNANINSSNIKFSNCKRVNIYGGTRSIIYFDDCTVNFANIKEYGHSNDLKFKNCTINIVGDIYNHTASNELEFANCNINYMGRVEPESRQHMFNTFVSFSEIATK